MISTLSAVLTLLSAHYPDHSIGHPIMKTLLQPVTLRWMNSYIGGSHNDLIIVTLKLYNVMSSFASGRDKNSVLAGFGWDIKVFFIYLDYPGTNIRSPVLTKAAEYATQNAKNCGTIRHSFPPRKVLNTRSLSKQLSYLFVFRYSDAFYPLPTLIC